MYELGAVSAEPLGPGSKEKRSALEALALAVNIDLSSEKSKISCGAVLAEYIGVEWDESCFSRGDTITAVGLARLVEGVERVVRRPVGARLASPDESVSTERNEGSSVIETTDSETERSIADAISTLSEPGDVPAGVVVPFGRIDQEDVTFDDGSWRSSLAAVQDWLHLPRPLDETSAQTFDESLAFSLDVDGTLDEDWKEQLFVRLLERLDFAVAARRQFLETLEGTAEGAATLETATQDWVALWDEIDDEAEAEAGGDIHASADVWPISQFVAFASDNELELSPSYQRADVWPKGLAQSLIESVIRGIPLPSIIILQREGDNGARYEVVDGKQRLTSILRFIGHHPVALAKVREKAAEWRIKDVDVEDVFLSDYRKFRRLWKQHEPDSLTSQLESAYYFPFPLRAGEKAAFAGQLEALRGKYYCEIREQKVSVVGEQRQLKTLFEQMSDYRLPVIVYKKATPDQIHEVFSLYNKQGKHLNAEEIRNALFHHLDFMRALLVTAGDSEDVEGVANFLAPDWHDLSSTPGVLDGYGFGKAGYKRTKVLSWVASVLFLEAGNPSTRSTSRQISLLLSRVNENLKDPLRASEAISAAMLLLDHGLDAHALVPDEVWAPRFKNAQGQSKWQELQLVSSMIALSAARAVYGEELDDVVEGALDELAERSQGWKRPEKTQSKIQWVFIAETVADLLDVLDVSIEDADARIRAEFGYSGLALLTSLARG